MAPVYHGGLDILDLEGIGKVLAAKWIYNYANNKDVMWKKVVCARSKGGQNRLMSAIGNRGNNSVLFDFLDLALGRNDRVRGVPKKGFRIFIGDGQGTDFLGNN